MGVYCKGGEFYIDFYVKGRRKREKIGPSKTLAIKVLRKRKVEIAENKFLDIDRVEKIKFEDFFETFLKLNNKATAIRWREAYRTISKPILKYFGNKYLHEITSLLIHEYIAERSRQHTPQKKVINSSTVKREITCLGAILSKAVLWGKLQSNPMKLVEKPKEENSRWQYLEPEEAQKLVDACNPSIRPVVLVALNTGMRKGEILNLKWDNVDLIEAFHRFISFQRDLRTSTLRSRAL